MASFVALSAHMDCIRLASCNSQSAPMSRCHADMIQLDCSPRKPDLRMFVAAFFLQALTARSPARW